MVNWRKTWKTTISSYKPCIKLLHPGPWMCSECIGAAPTSWWKMRITSAQISVVSAEGLGFLVARWTRKDWTTDGQWSLPISMTLSDGSIGFHHRVCFACCTKTSVYRSTKGTKQWKGWFQSLQWASDVIPKSVSWSQQFWDLSAIPIQLRLVSIRLHKDSIDLFNHQPQGLLGIAHVATHQLWLRITVSINQSQTQHTPVM